VKETLCHGLQKRLRVLAWWVYFIQLRRQAGRQAGSWGVSKRREPREKQDKETNQSREKERKNTKRQI
jgi:hypothetical protein